MRGALPEYEINPTFGKVSNVLQKRGGSASVALRHLCNISHCLKLLPFSDTRERGGLCLWAPQAEHTVDTIAGSYGSL